MPNQYNSDVSACQTNYNQCASFGRTACQSAASTYCGLNNPPIGVYFNPDTGSCSFTSSCNPGGRPSYCPGGPNAASCGGSGGWYCNSPLLVDTQRNGVSLTTPEEGVLFDLQGSGDQRLWSWTAVHTDDGWLALDRNGNGRIDSGLELFGSTTTQPAPPSGVPPNGFSALALFDTIAEGGNNDGLIDSSDAIFASLLLWTDRNHNGISEPEELSSLTTAGVSRIDLEYKERKNDTDQFGNLYLFRARSWDGEGHKLGWVWDVFLRSVQP